MFYEVFYVGIFGGVDVEHFVEHMGRKPKMFYVNPLCSRLF